MVHSDDEPPDDDGNSGTESMFDGPSGGLPGIAIDGYRVQSVVGEGAFGVVYRARRLVPPRRLVAVKVLRHGLDSARVLARFEAEQQVLAMMNHPSIISVLHSGTTTDGRPFFAMELVEGEPITAFCDRNRLGIERRLALFQEVCGAVQHAHHKGVIHRDLKPSNVLVADVEGRAVVKIIDFGIAKALGSEVFGFATLTAHDQLVGTPAYMSPEQADPTQRDVDTRSDVYSLGVLLYELVSGSLPYGPEELRRAGLAGLQRLLQEVDPPRPSERLRSIASATETNPTEAAERRGESLRTLVRRLHGDLDWVVMRCLEKDRNRRYSTASELVADIGRFLRDEPVLAGPPTLRNRARKLLRRHRALALGSTAVIVTALIGIVIATVLATRLAAQQSRLREQQIVELLAGAQRLGRWDKDNARRTIEQALALAPGDPRVQREEAYQLATRGKPDVAAAHLRAFLAAHPDDSEALAFLAGLVAPQNPHEAAALRARANAETNSARALFAEGLGTTDDKRAIELFNQSLTRFPWDFDAVWQRGIRRYNLGLYEDALADAELLVLIAPTSPLVRTLRGATLAMLTRYDDALVDFGTALEKGVSGPVVHVNRAFVYLRMGRVKEAVDDVRHVETFDLLDTELADIVGQVYRAAGQHEPAERAFTRAIEASGAKAVHYLSRAGVRIALGKRELAAEDLRSADRLGIDGVDNRAECALGWLKLGRPDAALEQYRAALNVEPGNARVHALFGRALAKSGKRDEGLAHLRRAVELEPRDLGHWADLGAFYWTAGRRADAIAASLRATGSSDTAWVRVWLWELLSLDGRSADASRQLDLAEHELDSPLMKGALAVLRGGALPDTEPPYVATDNDRLYWHFTLAAAATIRGDRARTARECDAILQLGNVSDAEVDVAEWKRKTLT